MRSALIAILFLIPAVAAVAGELPRTSAVPGGIAVVPLDSSSERPPRVTFDGQRVLAVKEDKAWHAVIGIPLSLAPGEHWLEITGPEGTHSRLLVIQPKDYEAQYITIEDERKVEPLQEDLERIWREEKIKDRLSATWSERIPQLSFSLPVEGPVSSVYGLRRFFNNQPRSPHSGLDIAAPAGTPIRAPAGATVLYADNFFFSGNMVYLDHGGGLLSLYAHMQNIAVESGETVERGDVIGAVGATGRVTGPHLHWGVYLNRTPVDPVLFLTDEALAKL